MINRYFIFALLMITAAAIVLAMKKPRNESSPDRASYLKFSHARHVKENGIECADCHTAAATSKLSGDNLIANHDNCKMCHEDKLSADCKYCHTTEDIVAIPNPPRELTFSHEKHAGAQKLKCESCHEGMPEATTATANHLPGMTTCTSCHTEKKISTNCETCHKNFTSLIPADHRTGEFRKDHAKRTRLGDENVSCAVCHADQFCQDCHTGDELRSFGSTRDLMTDPSHWTSVKDSPKPLRVQRTHSLNYKYSHGIDVKSRFLDCSTCHDAQTFCAECHEAGGNITQMKFKPASHMKAGFVTIGRGSGGGLHGEMARRDIESCASCHDVHGNDPVCLTCHTENGSVR
jgi:hypothetical protein